MYVAVESGRLLGVARAPNLVARNSYEDKLMGTQ